MTLRKLTLQDQAAINLCGWLTCQVFIDAEPNFPLVIDQLRRLLPDITSDNGLMSDLSRAIIGILAHANNRRSMEWSQACWKLSQALSPIFFYRAACACDALWPQPEYEEPAHAAQ